MPAGGRGVRLTRRGRVVVLLVLCGLVLAAFSVGRMTTSAAGTARPVTRHVVVHPGDSLWTIARRAAPTDDPRAVVERIQQLNGLSSTQLRVGQQLALPTP